MNKASEDKLEFYTADPLGDQETAIRRGLTLPQAIPHSAVGRPLPSGRRWMAGMWKSSSVGATSRCSLPIISKTRTGATTPSYAFRRSTWPSPRWASAIRAKAGQSSALVGASISFNCAASASAGAAFRPRCAVDGYGGADHGAGLPRLRSDGGCPAW